MTGLFTVNQSTLLIGGAVFSLALLYVFHRKPRKPKNYPPGPKGVPLYGNLLEIRRGDLNGPGLFDKWAREFGDVYSVVFGSYDAVILNSADVVKDFFIKNGDKTGGRALNVFFFSKIFSGKIGITFNEGDEWKANRRAALHSMRDMGMGKKSLEEKMQEEASFLIDLMDKEGDKAFNPKIMLHNAFSNIISSIVFGKRCEYDDPDFIYFSTELNKLFSGGGFKNAEIFIPIMTPLVPILNPGLFTVANANSKLSSYVRNKVKKHKPEFDPEDIKCLIDVYMKAQLVGELPDERSEENLLMSITDVFIAGSETTSTTTRWALLYLVIYPEVQAKCQQEIKHVIGQVRLPNQKDRPRLPYVEATINEVHRMASIVAYGLLHRAEVDFELHGYTIPKDTIIFPNLHFIHNDPRYWGDPENFRPERWLDGDGVVRKHDSFMPFSVGPRECLGKSLAAQGIFIILVSLLQKFTFGAKDPEHPPKLSGSMGIVHLPNDFEITVSKI